MVCAAEGFSVEKTDDKINDRPYDSDLAVFLLLELGEFLVRQGEWDHSVPSLLFDLPLRCSPCVAFSPEPEPVFGCDIHRGAIHLFSHSPFRLIFRACGNGQ